MSRLQSMRVVLADDNASMRHLVCTILGSVGVTHVRTAPDGMKAFDMLRDGWADVAIVDFMMAPVDGVEFTRMVRTSPQSPNPHLPIIMMTGHSARSHVMEARDAGVTEFIVKPVTAKTILDRLHSVIYHPRPFVRVPGYCGPERRRRVDPNYRGVERRQDDRARQSIDPITGDLDNTLTWELATPRSDLQPYTNGR